VDDLKSTYLTKLKKQNLGPKFRSCERRSANKIAIAVDARRERERERERRGEMGVGNICVVAGTHVVPCKLGVSSWLASSSAAPQLVNSGPRVHVQNRRSGRLVTCVCEASGDDSSNHAGDAGASGHNKSVSTEAGSGRCFLFVCVCSCLSGLAAGSVFALQSNGFCSKLNASDQT
jgi:hypothetical protein